MKFRYLQLRLPCHNASKILKTLNITPKHSQRVRDFYFSNPKGILKLRLTSKKSELLFYQRESYRNAYLATGEKVLVDSPHDLKEILQQFFVLSCNIERQQTVFQIGKVWLFYEQVDTAAQPNTFVKLMCPLVEKEMDMTPQYNYLVEVAELFDEDWPGKQKIAEGLEKIGV